MKNKVLIFFILAGFTLLLLDIPKKYYLIQDQNLLTEQGRNKYETAQTNTINDFSQKIESFFNYTSGLPTNGIGYTKELSAAEISVVIEHISNELQFIAAPYEQSVFLDSVFCDEVLSAAPAQCFTAQVFQRQAETQYVWEVGYLILFSPKNHIPFANVIYDTDTYKIIMLNWNMPADEIDYKYISNSNTWEERVAEYYFDVAKEFSYMFIDDGRAGLFYPSPLPHTFVSTSTLYHDLQELAQYFWYMDFQRTDFTEYIIQE